MLDARGAVTLLVEQGLLDPSEVVSGELRIVEASRRNRNLHVLRRRASSYVLKQGLGAERRETVAHEAAIHAYLHTLNDRPLSSCVPQVAVYLPAECVLVLEFVAGAESLERRHVRRARHSIAHARLLAEALIAVHGATAADHARTVRERRFPAGVPWMFSMLHRPGIGAIEGLSNGGALAIRMMQSASGFAELVEAAAQAWTPACLVHGDLRFDNCLVSAARDSPRSPRMTLVDWELALWGDPCWDAGAVLASYLRSWVQSCPIVGEAPLDAALDLGRDRLPQMQRAAGAFWAAYHAGMTTTRASRTGVPLRRVMQFAAIRLLQNMLEELQGNAELTARAVCLAQLAFNVLARPDEAADTFLARPVAA